MHGLLTAVAPLAVEHRLQGIWASVVAVCRLNSRGTWAALLHSMWDLPRLGIGLCLQHWQADSLSLSHQGSPAGGFLITGPPRKSSPFNSCCSRILVKLKLLSTTLLCFCSFDGDTGGLRRCVTCSGPTGASGRCPDSLSRTFSTTQPQKQQPHGPEADPGPRGGSALASLGRKAGKPEVGGGAEQRVGLCP